MRWLIPAERLTEDEKIMRTYRWCVRILITCAVVLTLCAIQLGYLAFIRKAHAEQSLGVYITYLYPGTFCNKVYTSDGKVWAVAPGAINEKGILAEIQVAILTHQRVNIAGGGGGANPVPLVPLLDTIPCYGSNPATGALEVQQFPNLAGIVPYDLTE